VLNNSTILDAEDGSPQHDETMVTGTRTCYDPPRMFEDNLEGNDEGSDEYPMTLEEERRRRAQENRLEDGQWQDWG